MPVPETRKISKPCSDQVSGILKKIEIGLEPKTQFPKKLGTMLDPEIQTHNKQLLDPKSKKTDFKHEM